MTGNNSLHIIAIPEPEEQVFFSEIVSILFVIKFYGVGKKIIIE